MGASKGRPPRAGDVLVGTESGIRADGSRWAFTDRIRIVYAGRGVILALHTHRNGKPTGYGRPTTWTLAFRKWRRVAPASREGGR